MANVTLLQYNNYFNRIIKKEASYANYVSAASGSQFFINVNFVPGDNVRTSIILGTSALNMSYDYLLVHHTNNGNVVIDSRWFIMDENRTRDGQYEVTLKRDVIIDNYNKVIAAPMFMEKGFVSSLTNPLLYNKESMTYNQIKDSETLLKDATGCAWVVGYVPQDAFQTATTVNKEISQGSIDPDIRTDTLESWAYYRAVMSNPDGLIYTTDATLNKAINLKYTNHFYWSSGGQGYAGGGPIDYYQVATVTPNGVSAQEGAGGGPVSIKSYNLSGTAAAQEVFANLPADSTLWGYYDTLAQDITSNTDRQLYVTSQLVIDYMKEELDGKILYVADTNTYYMIHWINLKSYGVGEDVGNSAAANALVNEINTQMVRSGSQGLGTYNADGNYTNIDVSIGMSADGYMLTLGQVTYTASVTIDANRNHVVDAPYDIFCIPYSNTKQIRIGGNDITCSEQLAIGVAQEIAAQAGSQSVYDVQLLPYCPSQELINSFSPTVNPSIFNLDDLSDSDLAVDVINQGIPEYKAIGPIRSQSDLERALALYTTVYDSNYRPIYYYNDQTNYYIKLQSTGSAVGAIIWCTRANRSFDILQTITRSNDPVERKVENECDLYRLCSGNYQGVFEFSAAKSYNGFSGYRVDCTFKPYNPYIHVIPKLTGLYGTSFSSFSDVRGLICGGDFSLAQLSNAWANYELQNKNYQNIFDRQIQSLDLNNSIARQEAGWNIAGGIVSGGVGGAMTGASVGGGYGAIAGAVVGAGSSLIGGVMDYANLEKRQEDAKDYAIDMFGYQLGNIRALPTSIARNSALTANTKVFPFVEKYTCTDTEKQALRDKITYNGMTMMVISTLNTYMVSGTPHFFKGKIIRLDSLGADNHMAQAIYEELYKGVYI